MRRRREIPKMIRHRGLESDSFTPLPTGKEANMLYNPFWGNFGIPSEIPITPLPIGKYAVIITDPTLYDVVTEEGRVVMRENRPIPVEGGSNGFYINDPQIEPTLPLIEILLEKAIHGEHGIALPLDVMYNRNADRDDRLTKTVLRRDYLLPSQRRIVTENNLEQLEGRILTLAQFEQIFGPVKDKEFHAFPEHSEEYKVKLLPKFVDAVRNQAQRSTIGHGRSPYTILPFQKDGLYPLIPADEHHQQSNRWDKVFETWFAGRQGIDGRKERKVFIAGACIDYSVGLAARWMMDTGYDVTVIAPAVKGLGITPKPVALRELAEAYAIKVTWDWPTELGETPDNWDELVDKVKQEDQKVFESTDVGSWDGYIQSMKTYMPWGD